MRPEIAGDGEGDLSIGVIVIAVFFQTGNPGFLNRQRIATDLDNRDVLGLEFLEVCAEPAHLVRSPTGQASGVERDDHCPAAEIGERNRSGVAVQCEIGGLCAGLKFHFR